MHAEQFDGQCVMQYVQCSLHKSRAARGRLACQKTYKEQKANDLPEIYNKLCGNDSSAGVLAVTFHL